MDEFSSYDEAQTNRRRFLTTTASGLILPSVGLRAGNAFAQNQSAPVAGKDKRLIVLTPFPAVLETPTKLLADAPITPIDRLFVRNNQQPEDAATTDPSTLAGWKIDLRGELDGDSVQFDAEVLKSMDQVEHEMVLQCSGNSRALFAQTVRSKGTQWGRGGMGNVVFGGVPLRAVLKKYKIDIQSTARFVTVIGRDMPLAGKEDFQHSLPVDDVLNRSMLAITLNQKPLPSIHGGPVRLVTPGIYGTMQMKWVRTLRFDAAETENYNQIPRYRVPNHPIKPGTDIKYTFDNSHYNWAMKVKSVVLSPHPGEQLPAGAVTVKGVAFNDGQSRIDSVLVSFNHGQSWERAKLTRRKSPYAWTGFELSKRLDRGRHSIWTRAVDAWGRSQPMDGSVHWNPSGYEWNGVEKIDVTVG